MWQQRKAGNRPRIESTKWSGSSVKVPAVAEKQIDAAEFGFFGAVLIEVADLEESIELFLPPPAREECSLKRSPRDLTDFSPERSDFGMDPLAAKLIVAHVNRDSSDGVKALADCGGELLV